MEGLVFQDQLSIRIFLHVFFVSFGRIHAEKGDAVHGEEKSDSEALVF